MRRDERDRATLLLHLLFMVRSAVQLVKLIQRSIWPRVSNHEARVSRQRPQFARNTSMGSVFVGCLRLPTRRATQSSREDQLHCRAAVAGSWKRASADAPKAIIPQRAQHDHPCPDASAKISFFRICRNDALLALSRLMQRDVRVVTIRRGGERWPRVCQALLRKTTVSSRTFKPCGPGVPMLAPSLSDMTCR